MRDPRSNTERLFAAPIDDFPFPGERQRLIRSAEDRPPAFGGRLGAIGHEAAVDREVDVALGQGQRRCRNRRGRRRQYDRLRSASCCEGQREIEREDEAAGSGEQHVRRCAADERHRLAVETRIAYEESGGNLHARPGVAEDVDGEPRSAADRFAVNAKVVVDARQRGIDRWRCRRRGRRLRPFSKSLVFVEGKHHPAFRRRCRLSREVWRGPGGDGDQDTQERCKSSSTHTRPPLGRCMGRP